MRGVRHEVALALERRLALAASGAQLAEHVLEREREVETSSLACGFGSVTSGSRVLATSRAARVRPAIGRIARRATNRPPTNARSVPPITPKPRNRRTLLIVCATLLSGLPYWTYANVCATGLPSGSAIDPVPIVPATSGRETTR